MLKLKTGSYREWNLECSLCGHKNKLFGWSYDLPFKCRGECGSNNYMPVSSGSGQTVMISTDDIPGGIEIRHLDSTPKRYYSKTEIKRRANEKGVVISGDSPVPYKVAWSGKREET